MARVRYTSVWKNVNVRPDDYSPYTDNRGDCSTRCLTWILNGNYREIENRQYAIAADFNNKLIHEGFNYHRNSNDVYSVILHEHGYKWIRFSKTVSRGKLAVLLSDFEKIVSLSRTHVCPIHKGYVIDNWDSTAGQVFALCVKVEDIEAVRETVEGELGIETEIVEKVRCLKKKKRRVKTFWWD